MAMPEQSIQAIVEVAERRERAARRRAFLYATVPLVLAALIVGFTALQIQKLGRVQGELSATEMKLASTKTELVQFQQEAAQSLVDLDEIQGRLEETEKEYQASISQLEATRMELEKANIELGDTQKKIEDLNKQTEELTISFNDLKRQYEQFLPFFERKVTITEVDVKEAAQVLPEAQVTLLFDILNLSFQDIPFNVNGASLEDGFNSPSFAVYVLQQRGLLPEDYDFNKKPWEQLPRIRRADNGDLVYYESGYAMFYFNKPVEFVIGMTPVGIISMKPDFAPILGYLDVIYP
jgi:hypothetical protein